MTATVFLFLNARLLATVENDDSRTGPCRTRHIVFARPQPLLIEVVRFYDL